MSDLTLATRELFIRTLKAQVFMQMPFYEELQRRSLITFKGGKYIERLLDVDEMDDLAQAYSTNEALTDSAKDMLDKPRFTWKKWQIPLRYDCDWEIQNANAGNEEQLLDLPQFLVKKAQRAVKIRMMKYAFNDGSATTTASDSAKTFQSLPDALIQDVTYGTLARTFSTGIRDWWQPADPAGLGSVVTSGSQGTAYNMTISNARKWITESDIMHHAERQSDLYMMMCPTLFNKIRAEMEAKLQYKPTGDTQKQGFNKMLLDGNITIASVPYLQTTTTMKKWVFILHLPDWELRINTARNFKMTPFEWQGANANGYDYYLSRILVAGNLICWKPNGSMMLTNIT